MISDESTSSAPRRIIMLGASNLTRGISTAVETAQIICSKKLEVFSALGHGRSYGMESSVLGITLPGIVSCGLWEAIDRNPTPGAVSLLTDIGNDLLYGASVDQITEWIDSCLTRLLPHSSRMVVTTLPIESLRKLGPIRFHLMKKILFPQSKIKLAEAVELAHQLNREVIKLAHSYQISVIHPVENWYRVDPIHIRMKYWDSAWQKILSPWSDQPNSSLARGSFKRWFQLRRLRPLERRFLGFQQYQSQPSGKLPCGSTISLY